MRKMMEKIILTGDRPTGKLHVGHYVGSLKRRVELQIFSWPCKDFFTLQKYCTIRPRFLHILFQKICKNQLKTNNYLHIILRFYCYINSSDKL